MDPELGELAPLFVEEARERLERLAGLVPQLASDEAARLDAKRELHTLKGAARMLRVPAVAELAHAAEELFEVSPADLGTRMLAAADGLSAMVEAVARGEEPELDPRLLQRLAGGAETTAAASATLPGVVTVASETVHRPAGADVRVDARSLDGVADQATQVRILALSGRGVVGRLYELAKLAEQGLSEPQPTQVLAVLSSVLRRLAVEVESSQRRLLRSSEDALEGLLTLQLQPLRGSLLRLGRYARDLARSLGREVEVTIDGENTRLDRRIARELDDSLLHLVRNAIDHGIEPPAERVAQGKPAVGQLRLVAATHGGRVRLSVTDDGGGIDREAVLARAVRGGLVDTETAGAMTRDEVYRLLFAPGFSTRGVVSEISGRGVGLDVVARAVARVGGEVLVAAEPGRGTTVHLDLPLARRGEQVMLVRVGQARLALPRNVVREVLRFPAEAAIERDGRTFLDVGGRLVPFVPLARLFGQVPAETQLLLRGRVSGQPVAVAVDTVESEEEVLVRSLPAVLTASAVEPVIEGMALLASGEPVGVLSPGMLAQRSLLRQPTTAVVAAAPVRRVRVLLVDDSMVTREMERRLLEDAGFAVTTAANADEGLLHLSELSFDCLVTDIEMPGMDGFELTHHLRSLSQFTRLPIVVVSTRDRPEDRLRGLQAGADAYLTKQSLDAGELVDIVLRLAGTR